MPPPNDDTTAWRPVKPKKAAETTVAGDRPLLQEAPPEGATEWHPVGTKKERIETRKFPGGFEGTVTAQTQGQLHGLSGVLGAPVDLASAGLRAAGVPIGDEPLLGSKSIRRIMGMPGEAAGFLADRLFGEGSASRYGLSGHATYQDINEVPPEYRSQARMGEVFGETVGTVAPISRIASLAPKSERFAAALTPTGSVTKDLARQQLAEASRPGFGMKQMAAAAPAAGGAWLAEAVFPGSQTAQTIAQLGGGLGGAAAVGGAGAGISAAKKPLDPLLANTPEGAKTIIARSLGKELAKNRESPEGIIRNLRETPAVPGARPGERTGSPVMLGVEKALAANNPDLANTIAQRNAQFESNLTTSINQAFAPGERGALTRAAESFRTQLDTHVLQAEEAAREAAGPLAPLATAERETVNLEARQILESALSAARASERQLWSAVPRAEAVTASRLTAEYQAIRDEMLPEANLPPIIQRVMTRLAETPATTLGELQNLRSEILDQARTARAASEFNTARRLELLGRAALTDMETIGGESARLARAFSRELNDRFSRSFAGNVLGLRDTGAASVRPGLTLESAMSGRPQTAAEKLRELQVAATNIPPQIGPDGNIIPPGTLSPEMRQRQEQFLRSLSSRIIDPTTERVNPGRTASFLRDYGPVLDQFPYYRQQIEDALTAQLGSEYVAGIVQDAQREAFSRVLDAGEVPMHAVAAVLASPTPTREFVDLARLAQGGGPEAVGGLRAAILDLVADRAVRNGSMSYTSARDTLLAPVIPNGPSLLGMMQSNGVVSRAEADAILARVQAGIAHERSGDEALRIDTVGDEAGKMARWGARILGAKLSSWLHLTKGGAGPSLQVASIAASAAEQAITRLPLDKARKVLTDAFEAETPEKLIDILERISPEAGRISQSGNIRYMIPLFRTMLPREQTEAKWRKPGAKAAAR